MGDWGTTASTAGTAGEAASTAGTAGSAVSSAAPAATSGSGFALDVSSVPNGWDASTSAGIDAVNADKATYGTYSPTMWDRTGQVLADYSAGREQSMGDAWKNMGWNAKTAGYVGGKLDGFIKPGGGGGGQPQIVNNIAYQQPDNEYLRRRRGY